MRPNPTGRAISAVVVSTLVLSGFYLRLPGSAPPKSDTQATSTSPGNGLTTATFTTANGSKITVNLPDDLAAGDTFSGTVVEQPAGSTDEQRAASQDELNGYVIEMGTQKAAVGGKTFKWVIPASFGGAAEMLVLKDKNGKKVAQAEAPVSRTAAPSRPAANPAPGDFQLPTVGQAGRPIQVQGPFDGDFANTQVKVGRTEARLLAESPRKLVARSPENVVGPTEIQCTEGSVTATGPFRNVAVKLSGETTLQRGQTAPLTLTVSGLQGLQQDMPLRLANRSTQVVEVAQGNDQSITIHPADVQADGTYHTTRTLTGKQAGAFDITATVFAMPGLALHMKAFSDLPPGMHESDHVKDITFGPPGVNHLKDVSWPPSGAGEHVEKVSWGLPGQGAHEKGKTWPKDTGGSVPGAGGKDVTPTHKPGITWPPKGIPGPGAPNWPDHTKGITWPPYHVDKISWPSHTAKITWAPKDINPEPGGAVPAPYDWPQHLKGVTWAPRHDKGQSPPPHLKGVTWAPYHTKDVTYPKHQTSGSWPKQ